jgi:DNA-binding XRE family transcriptional regulator
MVEYMSLDKINTLLNEVKKHAASLESDKLKHEPIPLDKFGDYLRDYRKDNDITQEYLADICGVSKNIIVNIEKGRESVTLQNFLKVTNNIGVKVCLL